MKSPARNEKVDMYFDNDKTGKETSAWLMVLLSLRCYLTNELPSAGKSYNDYLHFHCEKEQKEKEIRIRMNIHIY